MLFADLAVLSAAFWLAFLFRFDGAPPLQMWKRLLFTWPYVVAFQYSVLYLYAVPRFVWRYVGLRETARVGAALGVAGGVLLAVRLVAGVAQARWGYAIYALIPTGVILADTALAFVGIVGIRAARRLWGEEADARARRSDRSGPARVGTPQRTLLIGAGEAGVAVARDLTLRPNLGLLAVGFIDDDLAKRGQLVHGVRVLGPTGQLAAFAEETKAQQAIITIASARGQDIRRIVGLCEAAGRSSQDHPGRTRVD